MDSVENMFSTIKDSMKRIESLSILKFTVKPFIVDSFEMIVFKVEKEGYKFITISDEGTESYFVNQKQIIDQLIMGMPVVVKIEDTSETEIKKFHAHKRKSIPSDSHYIDILNDSENTISTILNKLENNKTVIVNYLLSEELIRNQFKKIGEGKYRREFLGSKIDFPQTINKDELYLNLFGLCPMITSVNCA